MTIQKRGRRTVKQRLFTEIGEWLGWLIILPIFVLYGLIFGTMINDHPKSATTVNSDIRAEFVGTKTVNGKHRYFLRLTNDGESSFNGFVKISLHRGDGGTIYFDRFETKSPMMPETSLLVYVTSSVGTGSEFGNFRAQICKVRVFGNGADNEQTLYL